MKRVQKVKKYFGRICDRTSTVSRNLNESKDIERVLHPYKILPNTAMKRAYFVGTAILKKTRISRSV
jgi:hypothetical protein